MYEALTGFIVGIIVTVIVGFFIIKNNKERFLLALDQAIEDIVKSGLEGKTKAEVAGWINSIKAKFL